MEAIRQCIGIDCAKKDFWVTFSVLDLHHQIEHRTTHKFLMNDAGLKVFVKWIKKYYNLSLPLTIVMEATGVYHEKLCNMLYDLGYSVSVVFPKRAKDFSKTLMIKKITDKIASKYLATMGLEKNLPLWSKPAKFFRNLRQLTRESEQLQDKIVMIKNEIEAENHRLDAHKNTLKRLNYSLKILRSQKAEVITEINKLIKSDAAMLAKFEKVTSIKGVGILTAAIVIGETYGFSQVKNKRQLVSYAGLDVINQESGTSVWTKPRISKRGNKHIRRGLQMAALSSIKHGENKSIFIRITARTGIKMKGVVACQRKLLVLIYTLWKNDTVFVANYEEKRRGDITSPQELELVRS